MRSHLQTSYTYIHRGLGCYGIILIGWFFLNLATHPPHDSVISGPIVLALTGLVICLMLIIKPFLPRFFRRPRKRWHLAPVLIGNGLLTVEFASLSQLLANTMTLPADQAQTVAMQIAALPMIATAMAWWIGLILCFWKPVRKRAANHEPAAQLHAI